MLGGKPVFPGAAAAAQQQQHSRRPPPAARPPPPPPPLPPPAWCTPPPTPSCAGTSTLNQLEKICEVIGKPSEAEQRAMNSPFANTMLDSLNVPAAAADQRGWARMYGGAGKDALDMLSRCVFRTISTVSHLHMPPTDPCSHPLLAFA